MSPLNRTTKTARTSKMICFAVVEVFAVQGSQKMAFSMI
jgi:hypothetical protein